MSLILQTGGNSIRSASGRTQQVTAPIPPAVTAGDIIVTVASVRGSDPVSVTSTASLDWAQQSIHAGSGTILVATASTPTASVAEAAREAEVTVDSGKDGRCTNLIVLRVTGGDAARTIEAVRTANVFLVERGTLEVPSFDPEWRTDNTLLYVATSSWPQEGLTPRATASGSASLYTETMPPEPEAEGGMEGLTTSLSHRRLTSADPTGTTTISFDTQPPSAWAVGVLLRSRNEVPVIVLPETWSAEVGRLATVSATVTDPDETPVSLAWSQTSGPEDVSLGNVYARAFQFTPAKPGVYGFRLVATDVDGGRTVADTQVVVPTGVASPATIVKSDGWVDPSGEALSSVEVFGDSDDSTFARTGGLPVGAPLTLGLPPIYGGAAVTLTIRGAATNPSPSIRRTVELRQLDGTLIAERSYDLSTVMRSYVFTTTRAETALISNRAALTLTITDEVV